MPCQDAGCIKRRLEMKLPGKRRERKAKEKDDGYMKRVMEMRRERKTKEKDDSLSGCWR